MNRQGTGNGKRLAAEQSAGISQFTEKGGRAMNGPRLRAGTTALFSETKLDEKPRLLSILGRKKSG